MNKNRSIAMISDPEFINLRSDALNPGISECEIKVLYLGKNRNGSYINRETAIQMADTLPGAPIVGVYYEDKQDYGDHGEVLHVENGEISCTCKTIPYGFVSPDAKVWFQKFQDTDEFDNTVEREYLMTTGYLWAHQYPEAASCLTEGKGQSMELDGETISGHWATDDNEGIEFFIIDDATFSKLCILGDDVEPCFEGASIKDLDVSKNFSLDKEFPNTLFSMMEDLKEILKNKGESDMPNKEFSVEEEVSTETFAAEGIADEVFSESCEEAVEEEFACGDDKKKKEYKEEEEEEKVLEETPSEEEVEKETSNDEEEEEEKKKSYTNEDFMALQEELEELRAFKNQQEMIEKENLINKYHMLSEEDKAPIVEHIEEYSLDDIESKLALAYVNKYVDFSSLTGEAEVENEDEGISISFSLDNEVAGFVPPVVEALRQVKK